MGLIRVNSGFSALKPPTVSVVVADQLRAHILSGRIPPGTRLRQVQLANEFGVSTTPIREAFQLLHSEGIVESDPHRGVVVSRPSASEVAQDYEIRCELEAFAAVTALPNLTDDHIARMEALEAEMEASADGTEYVGLNYEFHNTLYSASGRARLCALIDNLRISSSAYVYHVLYMSRLEGEERVLYLARLADEHHQILRACRARDLNRLTKAIREHIEHTAATIVASIRDADEADARGDGERAISDTSPLARD